MCRPPTARWPKTTSVAFAAAVSSRAARNAAIRVSGNRDVELVGGRTGLGGDGLGEAIAQLPEVGGLAGVGGHHDLVGIVRWVEPLGLNQQIRPVLLLERHGPAQSRRPAGSMYSTA